MAPSGPPQASSSPVPAPPQMSSPITTTIGSRRISSNKASLIAWRYDFWVIGSPLVGDVDVGVERFQGRLRRRLGLGHRVLDQLADLAIDCIQRRVLEQAGLGHPGAKQGQGVVLTAQPVDLAGGAVGLRIALVVAVEAVELAVYEARTVACARPFDRLARDLVDGRRNRRRRPCGQVDRNLPRV